MRALIRSAGCCFPFLAVAGVVALAPSFALAGLLEYEPFDYPANLGQSVNTLNGGTGWGGAWSDTDTDVPLASTNASLSYPGGTGSPTGGRIELTAADTSAQAVRAPGTTMNLSTSGQTWYSSALMRRSALTGELSTVSFINGTNIRWFYGVDANGKFTVAVDPGNAAQRATSTALQAEADTTYLLVAKIRTNTAAGGNDDVFLQVFGPNDVIAEPATDNDWTLRANGNSGVTLNSIRLDFANGDGQTNQFDEFRVGTTWADVAPAAVPEPSTLALVAIGLLGAAGFCWRRKS